MATDVFLGVHAPLAPTASMGPMKERPPRPLSKIPRGGYPQWFSHAHLGPQYDVAKCAAALPRTAEYWNEYYRPLVFTPLGKHFAFTMNSTVKLFGCVAVMQMAVRMMKNCRKSPNDADVSPFLPRVATAHPPRRVNHLAPRET